MFYFYCLLNNNNEIKINNEFHLYKMLITNLLAYFSRIEIFCDITSRKIVFKLTW